MALNLKELHCMLQESLERDEEMLADLRELYPKSKILQSETPIDQNLSLEDLLTALVDAMGASINTIDGVTKRDCSHNKSMIQHLRRLGVLLTIFAVTRADVINCSEKNVCFGAPALCDPSMDCNLIFQFDDQGNLDVELRDFPNPRGYVAIVVKKFADNSNEYLFCIPHEQRRIRAIAKSGEAIQITEQHMARYVQKLPRNGFKCSFLASELPATFKTQKKIIASTGLFIDNLVVPQGELVQTVQPEEVFFHRISSSFDRNDDMLTPDERKMASDLVAKVRRISNNDDGSDLEELLKKKKKTKDEDEDDKDLEEMLDSRKKFSIRRREESRRESTNSRNRSSRRPSRRESDDEDNMDEDDDDDDDADFDNLPKKKKRHPSRRAQSEEEEDDDEVNEEPEDEEEDIYTPRRREKDMPKKKTNRGKERKPSKARDDDYEDDKSEDDDDYDDASSQGSFLMIVATCFIVFLR
uniref:Uncharacterized protein n=1 Tax=Caenorhabditis japonica TaxID=281687 RepID=A0A8R1HW48_CAEJA